MKFPKYTHEPDKRDYLIALVIAILALAAYVRTLAPDILYGDSAEFQTLAYTLGYTHSTGYPTYLFLGRLLGFLPISNPAWRISLLSAVCAAITLGGVYLLARYFTRNRIGPILGSMALWISYTFWSQAIIAEVYTPGMVFLVLIMLLLCRWQAAPDKRRLSLLFAALIAGIGFGVHASVWLIGPPAVAFVLWILQVRRSVRAEWLKSLLAGFVGVSMGLVIYLAAFLIIDWNNPPSSFIRTTLEPSRVFWKLEPNDFNSPFKRMQMTVISAQWGNALFPGGDFSFMKELRDYINRVPKMEFSPLVLLLAITGLVVMLYTRPSIGAFYPLTFLFSLFFILNYRVGDKYVFYLSTYIPLTVAAGAGMGFLLEWVRQYLAPAPGRGYRLLYLLPVALFITGVVQPSGAMRWKALRTGVASFVTEDYVFPVKNLKEPRLQAEMRLTGMPDNAVMVMDWRALYTTAYIAHVEQGRTNILFFEAMPAGNNGKIATTLIEELTGYLQEGRPIYVEQRYPGLNENFRILPTSMGKLYQLKLK